MRKGESRLRAAIRRLRHRTPPPPPGSDDWPSDVNRRLERLEARQKWLIALSMTTLAVVLRVNPDHLANILKGLITLP